MADEYRIDSHKLIFHPKRVAQWLEGERIYPVCMEISPSGSCNHRCVFCGLDYLGYKPGFLDKKLILDNLSGMALKGLKSIVVAGEGEPLLNKHTPEIINGAKKLGIDVAMSSNGVLLTKDVAGECLGSLTWIRFSVNAGTSETHHFVHKGGAEDFDKTITNISEVVRIKKDKGLKTTIGVQMLLIPDNTHEVVDFGRQLKGIGVDYFTVKPFSKHPKSLCEIDPNFDYKDYVEIEQELKELDTDKYKTIFRSSSMKKKEQAKCYNKCYGLPFWAYIDANAEVWACIAYIGDKKFSLGNLKEKSFVEIWESERQKEVVNHALNMDISKCRELCRLDEINKYLHEFKNPGGHVNFI